MQLRAGMIGLDTSHVVEFTAVINDPSATGELASLQIVAGYPGGTDLNLSRERVGGFTEELRKSGVVIVDSIKALLETVDVVLLESVDGRVHLREAVQVIESGKPLFIDKPVAGSLSDAIAIFEIAKRHNVPVWSASSLRFDASVRSLLNNDVIGDIVGCSTWGPCSRHDGIPEMFFYGIHGIEALFTVMGTGCESVTCVSSVGSDVLTGSWRDGGIGTYRAIHRADAAFGATAFGMNGIVTVKCGAAYEALCRKIADFFLSGSPPVIPNETLEIFAFMEAAAESKRNGGVPTMLADVL
jgi:Oxidoreductase family, NAD-binding Rossmann fold